MDKDTICFQTKQKKQLFIVFNKQEGCMLT